jgi:hypothetical protein
MNTGNSRREIREDKTYNNRRDLNILDKEIE